MNYNSIEKGTFLFRENRFVAKVNIDENPHTVHVKNTGRCRELLIPGATVYLEKSQNPRRKTAYDLVAVEKKREGKEPLLINMDSQIPNTAAEEWLKKGLLFSENAKIRREVVFENSRFDFYIEDGRHRVFLEVKGVTLEQDGVARFPDAPTLRGIKHINELIEVKKQGFDCYILFVIQMKEIKLFEPNYDTHGEFGEALKAAKRAGVKILAFDCIVTPKSITLDQEVKIQL